MSTPFSIRTAPLSTRPSPLNAAEIEAVAGGDNVVIWIIEPIAGSTP